MVKGLYSFYIQQSKVSWPRLSNVGVRNHLGRLTACALAERPGKVMSENAPITTRLLLRLLPLFLISYAYLLLSTSDY